jgi:transcriptional regulator with XRE-family HTH domain
MKKQIGAVLKRFREEKEGTTQADVAKAVSKSGKAHHGYIERIELGEKAPSVEYIEKLLEFYGRSEFDFFHALLSEYRPSSKPPEK